MTTAPLMSVPNVSEGRNPAAVEVIAAAFTAGGETQLLDVHRDADHHRAVFTLAGRPGSLADALAAGAAEAMQRVDVGDGRGQHPHVGAVDVVPLVYVDPALRGAACAEALVAADLIGALGVPVFLYGELRGGRTRAELRRGGVRALAERMLKGELSPDFGPPAPHPTAGATLVGARPPLVAFNLELMPPATVADARRIAGLIREGGAEGLPGVRAIGVAVNRNPPPHPPRRCRSTSSAPPRCRCAQWWRRCTHTPSSPAPSSSDSRRRRRWRASRRTCRCPASTPRATRSRRH